MICIKNFQARDLRKRKIARPDSARSWGEGLAERPGAGHTFGLSVMRAQVYQPLGGNTRRLLNAPVYPVRTRRHSIPETSALHREGRGYRSGQTWSYPLPLDLGIRVDPEPW